MPRTIARTAQVLLLAVASIATVGVAPAQANPRPVISSLSPSTGPVGTNVLVSGDHFRGTKSVSFNGTRAASFRILSRREIRATVPPGASTGPVEVRRANQTATSPGPFVVESSADLWLEVEESSDPVVAGSTLTYTVFVNNAGPLPASDTNVVDVLPSEVMFKSASDGGSYDPNTRRVTWHVGTVGADASVTIQLTVLPIHPEFPMTNVVSATTSSTDPGSPNDVEIDTTVDPEPGVRYVSVRDGGLTPSFRKVGLGETVQWDFFGPSTHEITDAHGLGLLDSGLRTPIDTYRFTFGQSAEIRTKDLAAFPLNNGKIVIPVQVDPPTGSETTSFLVRWALNEPPSGMVEDVQIKRPGGRWAHWHRGETTTLQVLFTPDAGPGVYSFRSRLRNPGDDARSRFGPPVSITVA